jgi:ABC-2 type transport system ATP-binding protein
MTAAIEVENLSKSYGTHRAVTDVSFRVEPGSVTGFLGPNGAGKSTTLRMLVGFSTPTAGLARVLGVPYRRLPNPGRHVGVLLDASAQHPGRTGREILTLAAVTMGLDRRRVDAMTELVGLTKAEADRRVGNYSLGMRQRLGVAHALIGDPRVLILDEPANGLDPAGIHWMRSLLRDFADRGGAVLLSSHLLREIEVIADDLVVVGRGRVLAKGGKQELLSGGGTYARAADARQLAAALSDAGLEADPNGDGYLIQASAERVAAATAAAGVVLLELRAADGDQLEELFLHLTAETAREEASR